MKLILALDGSGLVLQAVLSPSLFFSLSLRSINVIVVEIYSEISLLTPTALVLNEWPVKLMGQIQSFLVTHFTLRTHTHSFLCTTSLSLFLAHTHTYLHTHLPVSLSLTFQSSIRNWSQLYRDSNHSGYKNLAEWVSSRSVVTLTYAIIQGPWGIETGYSVHLCVHNWHCAISPQEQNKNDVEVLKIEG